MARGEKVFESVQARRGWQMLEKSCRETRGPFRLTGGRSPQTGVGRLCLTCTRDKNPDSSGGNAQRALGRVGPAFPGGGGEQGENCTASFHSRSFPPGGRGLSGLQQPSVWQETNAGKGTSLQRPSYSGRTAGRPSCGRVCCLRKPPRRRGATGKGKLCQGSLLHWR